MTFCQATSELLIEDKLKGESMNTKFINELFHFGFKGLSREYYWRQMFFSSIFLIIYFIYLWDTSTSLPRNYFIHFVLIICGLVNFVLYPYSKFTYESIMNFLLGRHIIIGNMRYIFFFKLFIVSICWSLAIFVAPFGVLYLYWKNKSDYSALLNNNYD